MSECEWSRPGGTVKTLFGTSQCRGCNLSFLIIIEWILTMPICSTGHEWRKYIGMVVKVIHPKHSKHWPYCGTHNWFVCSKIFKSWIISFTFQAYTLPHTLNCIFVSLFKFHIWILKSFSTAQNGSLCPDT